MAAAQTTFTHWLVSQVSREDAVGELAREVHVDIGTPHTTAAKLRDHLISRFAYDRGDTVETLAVFDQAAEEFEALPPDWAEAAPRSAVSVLFRDSARGR